MWKKIIDIDKKYVLNLTKENLKNFVELDPIYIEDEKHNIFLAKYGTKEGEMTHYDPIVELTENKFVPLDVLQEKI